MPKTRRSSSNKSPPLAKRLSRLYRCIAQPDTKVVISLGGGGIRMAAHVVVLRHLEELGIKDFVSEVWGASGGALMGLLYAYGVSPAEMQVIVENLQKKEQSSQIAPSLMKIAKNLMREAIMSTSSKKSMKGFHDIHDTIHSLMGECLQTNSEVYPFYCLAYNLTTNQTDVLTPHPIERDLYGEWMYQTNALDAVAASSSVPIIFKPKVIDDQYGRRLYADGATNEEIPSVSLYKKWLRDRELGIEKRKRLLVIAVNLNPEFSSLGFLDNWALKVLPVFQYIQMTVNYADLMRKARIEDQRRLLVSDPNVELWDINIAMRGGGLLNTDLIPKIISYAEKSVPEQFQRINDSLLV